jgi:hypothetical protein
MVLSAERAAGPQVRRARAQDPGHTQNARRRGCKSETNLGNFNMQRSSHSTVSAFESSIWWQLAMRDSARHRNEERGQSHIGSLVKADRSWRGARWIGRQPPFLSWGKATPEGQGKVSNCQALDYPNIHESQSFKNNILEREH